MQTCLIRFGEIVQIQNAMIQKMHVLSDEIFSAPGAGWSGKRDMPGLRAAGGPQRSGMKQILPLRNHKNSPLG